MADVEFVIRGQKVDPQRLENRVERAVLQEVEHSLRIRLTGVRCAMHDAEPRVTARGDSVDALEADLSGCCQTLIDRAVAALG